MATIANKYFVGPGQPYATVTQALNAINSVLKSGDFSLPSTSLPDGGNVNIVLVGGGLYQPFVIPDNMTPEIYNSGRRLVITRQEFTTAGLLDTTSVPIITSSAPGSSEVSVAEKATGIDVGNNNPGVTIRGIFTKDCVIGLQAGFNSNYLRIERCVFTNNVNAQIYCHDLVGLNLVNNILVGGEYGFISKIVGKLRAYHNTVFVDGSTALSGQAKAGVLIQGERTFGEAELSTAYFAGNLVYTVGGPALVVYDGDLSSNRLVSDYNNLFSPEGVLVQLRQDTTQLTDEADIVLKEFKTLPDWRTAGPLGADLTTPTDKNSVSLDPVFVQKAFIAGTESSVLDLSLIGNSPMLDRVPSWYFTADTTYVPTDFASDISVDALLNTREKPKTSIGANDAPASNGFFGQDVFTSPLLISPEKSCDIDPLKIVTTQKLDMQYPTLNAGYFWSHERKFYLYGKKGASQLGHLARTKFKVPGHILSQDDVTIQIQGKEIPKESWDISGRDLYVLHKDHGIKSYEDEVHVHAKIQEWNEHGFYTQDAYYVFKIKDGVTDFVMPDGYNPSGPVVITDDRTSLRDPLDLVKREFKVEFDAEREETRLQFLHTENLIENSMFNISETMATPAYWERDISFTDEVFLLGPDFSYYGDYAAGVKIGPNPGWIGSNYIGIDEVKPLTISWHARIPTGMGLSGATGHYRVCWLDHNNDETIHGDLEGTFHVSQTGYSRYYLTVGRGDDVISDDTYEDFGIPVVKTREMFNIPSGASNIQLILSGDTNSALSPESFMVVDAVQIEKSDYPTAYHPELSFDYMTAEWENSEDGVFTDSRMNITPVFNENPNGFLCIQDMPASIWGGPDDENITTLHEYKWPIGRMYHLPWSRLQGKDKLIQRQLESEDLAAPDDIISPYAPIARPLEAQMIPDVLQVIQSTGDVAGFNIRVTDTDGNAYPLRKYTLQVYDTSDNFPGLLAKRKFGAKEQLGTTLYGELNSNGSMSAEYIGPANNQIKYIGEVPVPQLQASGVEGLNEKISSVKVPYRASLENNGNITVIGDLGKRLPTEATAATEMEVYGASDGNNIVITLPHPPVFGSVSLIHDGKRLYETQSSPQASEFLINYSHGQLNILAGLDTEKPFTVSYIPKYAYPDPSNPNYITFHHDKVFGNYTGTIQVDYDAQVFLEIRVERPFKGELISTFPIVLQNPELSKIVNNSLALEF